MKKKLLPLAVAAGLTGMVGGTAQAAMHVNDQGRGEALVYPFYSVEGGNDTYIHITNSTDFVKAVKVRFIEGHNSAEVLDFNLYLSPNDVWAGSITQASGGGAMIRTRDNSCTVPMLGTANPPFNGNIDDLGDDDPSTNIREQPFTPFGYEGDDVGRTTEGYVEVIEMGQLNPDTFPGEDSVHDADGVPTNCDTFSALWATSPGADAPSFAGNWAEQAGDEGTASFGFLPWGGEDGTAAGGLWGYGVVINVEDGTASGYDAIALDDFVFADEAAAGELHFAPGSNQPGLDNGQSVATIFDGANATDYSFADGADAVSALFMDINIQNDYVIDPTINALTDWVVTMPTKRFYVNGETPAQPFSNVWDGNVACEPVAMEHWDREEAFVPPPTVGSNFSPRPPQTGPGPDLELCTEVSIVQFGDDSALHGSEGITYGFEPDHTAGWARMSFDPTELNDPSGAGSSGDDGDFGNRVLEAASGDQFIGLPTVGFAALNYQNGQLNGGSVLANYAAAVEHKSERLIN